MGSVKKSVQCKVWWRQRACKIFVCIYEFLILAGELSLETLLVVWVSAVSMRRELIALGKPPFGWRESLGWNHLLYKIKARADPFVFLVCARTRAYMERAMNWAGILTWGTWGLHRRGHAHWISVTSWVASKPMLKSDSGWVFGTSIWRARPAFQGPGSEDRTI